MNTEVVEVSPVKREVKISYSGEEVDQAFKRATKAYADKVSISGFRQGKAPISIVQSRYADEIRYQVQQSLLQDGLADAMRAHNLMPVGPLEQPGEPTKPSAGEPFSFSVAFDVRPEIKLTTYKGLKITKAKVEITDVEINKELDRYRLSGGQLVPVMLRDTLEEKDYAQIDCEAAIDGQKVESMTLKDDMIELDPAKFIPGFVDALVGMKVGSDRTFELTYPEDAAPEVRGKKVTFRVHLSQIKKLELPPADDDFAKEAGFESLEKLKDSIKNSLTVVQNMRVRDKLRDQVYDRLLEAHTFEVPESLVVEQTRTILGEALRRFQQQGQRLDLDPKDVAELMANYRPRAERIVRTTLLLSEIAREEKINASEQDIETQIKRFADLSGQDPHRVHAQYADRQRREMLRFQIIDEKVLDFLIGSAEVAEGEPLPEPERQLSL